MKRWSRRSFLAGCALLAAEPAFAQRASRRRSSAPQREPQPSASSGQVDAIIVGAGAAGIAAARKLAAAGRTFSLVEAGNRIGGRCFTDTRSFGVPFDRGAHWIHGRDSNPLMRLASRTGLDIYQAPAGQRVRIGRRNAREGELEDYLAATVRANRAIAEAARGRIDVDCARALPKDLGEWQATIEFALGPFNCAKDLNEISTMDLSRAAERDGGAFCRQGYGALLAKLGEGLKVQLNTPVSSVEVTGRGSSLVEAVTPKGTITGRYIIVTASTNLLLSERIKFDGGSLPRRQLDALEKLKLGSLDHIALELTGNPLGLQRDELVFEKASGARTAALLANIAGSPLSVIEVGGRFGRELAGRGDAAMVDFAVEWLTDLFGTNVRKAVQRTQTTQWTRDPWTLGAIASASPGGQGARRIMMEPLRNRILFAGEAVHETLWGTVNGAWESGERAADMVVRRLLGQPDPPPPKVETEPAERPRPRGRGKS